MSDEFTSADDNAASTSGSSLRAALEAQIQRTKELEQENANLKSAQTAQELAKAWDGVPEQYKVAYVGEDNPDKIREWWTAAKPLFGVADETSQEQVADVQETAEQITERANQIAFQAASGAGTDQLTTVQSGLSKAESLRSREQNPSGRVLPADVDDVFKALGIPD